MLPIRIDFYLLEEGGPEARWLLACRLLEKAYARNHQVFVNCNHQEDAENLDELLWTFKDVSFIPHNLQGEGPEPPPPVQIGFGKEPRGFHDLLMNLADNIPHYYQRFQRVIEIVSADEVSKEISRRHYRDYKGQGCNIHIHQLSQSPD